MADNWRPLFQIAQVARGHWPERVAQAYEQLQAATARAQMEPQRAAANKEWESEAFIREALIPDIRRVFEDLSVERIFSRDLVDELSVLPDRGWQQRFGIVARTGAVRRQGAAALRDSTQDSEDRRESRARIRAERF